MNIVENYFEGGEDRKTGLFKVLRAYIMLCRENVGVEKVGRPFAKSSRDPPEL